jgi:hypothetical protein
VYLVQELLDPILTRNRVVVDEHERRHSSEPQPGPEPATKERSGAIERTSGLTPGRLITERGVKDARHLQVESHLHPCERHESDAWVVNFSA